MEPKVPQRRQINRQEVRVRILQLQIERLLQKGHLTPDSSGQQIRLREVKVVRIEIKQSGLLISTQHPQPSKGRE